MKINMTAEEHGFISKIASDNQLTQTAVIKFALRKAFVDNNLTLDKFKKDLFQR